MTVEITRRFLSLDLEVHIKDNTAKLALEEYNKIVAGLFPSSNSTYVASGGGKLYKIVEVE